MKVFYMMIIIIILIFILHLSYVKCIKNNIERKKKLKNFIEIIFLSRELTKKELEEFHLHQQKMKDEKISFLGVLRVSIKTLAGIFVFYIIAYIINEILKSIF